jgi:glycosyltransferase involved in cell wall biosynthesis
MKIAICHHLSLSYYGGGEKWIIELSKELANRGHEIEIYALPFLLDGKPKLNPSETLGDIPYKEGLLHKVRADVCYLTYNPLSWANFRTVHPRIAGIHSHAYWVSPHPYYGVLPNLANITNRFTSYFELKGFDAVHTVTNVFPINHPKVYYVPNFVDSEKFKPCKEKEDVFTVAYASRKVWQKGWDIFHQVTKRLTEDINVKLSGNIPEEDMPPFLSKNHVVVVPSRVDTFGLSIIESLMVETPVITTPLDTHRCLGVPLMYAETPTEITEKIFGLKHLWEKEFDNYIELSKSCRKSAMKYDKRVIIDGLENMLLEVANNA